MRNRFDQFAKTVLRELLLPAGHVATEEKVTGEVQKVDVCFVPDPARAGGLAALGLLGRMGVEPSLFEPHHGVVSVDEVTDCVRKHLVFRHALALRSSRAEAAATGSEPRPVMWILSSGRPERAITEWRLVEASQWCVGIYEAAPALSLRLVVLSELPRTRETPLLRLMSANRVLRDAVHDLLALPPDAFERRHVAPLLVRYLFEIPSDPTQQTSEDKEFIMNAQELFEEFRRETSQAGERSGERRMLIRLFAMRLGRPLTESEQRMLAERLDRLGQSAMEKAVLERTGAELATWLAAPDAG